MDVNHILKKQKSAIMEANGDIKILSGVYNMETGEVDLLEQKQ